MGHKCAVTVVLAPGGGLLFSGDDSGTILWWDTTGAYQAAAMVFRRPQRRLRGHVDAITALDVTPDGLLISASKDALLVVWSWLEGVPLHSLRAHHHCVTGIFIGALPRRSTTHVAARRIHRAERNAQKVAAEANWEATWRSRFSVRALPTTFECVAVSAGMDEAINAWTVACERVSDSDGSDADA
jgi:WD40 repeat protein